MKNETPDLLLAKLKKVYDEVGQDMQYFQTGLNVVRMLVEQGHNAESITAYLHLHCGVYAGNQEVKASLIKHGIVKY